MAIEIERRFFVAGAEWLDAVESSAWVRQAYLATGPASSVRVRLQDDICAWLTIKSAASEMTRAEFEYPIPIDDAKELLELRTGAIIEKRRHIVVVKGARWEVDVFSGDFAPLVIAEIELETKDQIFSRPNWLGEEITGDARFSNASLALYGLPEGFTPSDV